MKRALFLALWLFGCDAVPVAAVGIGPNKGYVQDQHGAKVELVPMSDGTVRVYTSAPNGDPQRVTGEIQMSVSAPSFSPMEVTLVPAEGGAYLTGRLPSPPQQPADVVLKFPSGANVSYSKIPLVAGGVAPVQAAGVPASFKPPHSGTVTRVGDNLIEVVLAPKGEVQTYVYTLDGALVPASEVKMSSVQVTHQNKPYQAKLKPTKEGYLAGKIDANVTIPAQAEVSVAFVEPVSIYGVVYQPSVILFPAYVVVAPIVIAPVVIVPTHIHYKGKHKHKKH